MPEDETAVEVDRFIHDTVCGLLATARESESKVENRRILYCRKFGYEQFPPDTHSVFFAAYFSQQYQLLRLLYNEMRKTLRIWWAGDDIF